jgi:phosphoribosylanthranilate isomerase
MTRVKICGITRRADLREAVRAGADALGFITDVPVETPRDLDPSTAADLVAAAPPFVTTTLVLVPESATHAVELAQAIGPDVVQLHGEFDPEELRFVRAETRAKLVTVVDATAHDRARELDEVTDAVLVDSTDDNGAGGTGEPHNWEATRRLADSLTSPVILAGGLTPENVGEAVETVAPFAVDVASGVESRGGVKDPEALSAFVRRVREATPDPDEVVV